MFIALGDLVKGLPKKSRVPKSFIALFVRRSFSNALRNNCADLPEEVLSKIKAASFKNGVLTVKATTLAAAELQMRSGGLIKGINEELGKKILFKIRFKNY